MGVVNTHKMTEGGAKSSIKKGWEKRYTLPCCQTEHHRKWDAQEEPRITRTADLISMWTDGVSSLFRQGWQGGRWFWWEGWGMGSSTSATAVSVLSVLRAIVKNLRLCRLHPLRAEQRVQHVKGVLVIVGLSACAVAVGVGLVRLGVRVVSLMVRQTQRGEDIRPVTQRVGGHPGQRRELKWVSGGFANFWGMGAGRSLGHVSPFSGWRRWGAASHRVTWDLFATCTGRTWMFRR